MITSVLPLFYETQCIYMDGVHITFWVWATQTTSSWYMVHSKQSAVCT